MSTIDLRQRCKSSTRNLSDFNCHASHQNGKTPTISPNPSTISQKQHWQLISARKNMIRQAFQRCVLEKSTYDDLYAGGFMGARVRVDLAPEQAATLKMWAGSGKTEQRIALRSRVILLAANGLGLKQIAEEIGLSFGICLKWRKRFLAMGLGSLQDKAERGRPLSISPKERVEVVALACTTPPDGSTRGSVRGDEPQPEDR